MTGRYGRWDSADMREDDLQQAVMEALDAHGWIYTHHRRSDLATTQGYPGEPDIRGIRDGRALWIECKSHRGRLTETQSLWLSQYAQVPNAVVRVIRPDGLDAFLAELRRSSGTLDLEGSRGLDTELRRSELHTLTHGRHRR